MASSPRVSFKLTSNKGAVMRAVGDAAARKVAAMGFEHRSTLVTEVLTGQRSGATYRIPGTSTTYQASKPGEAPASRTGTLRRSYRVSSVQTQLTRTFVRVGSELEYALFLEAGTSRMAQRPHLEPAYRLALPALRNILGGDWGI